MCSRSPTESDVELEDAHELRDIIGVRPGSRSPIVWVIGKNTSGDYL